MSTPKKRSRAGGGSASHPRQVPSKHWRSRESRQTETQRTEGKSRERGRGVGRGRATSEASFARPFSEREILEISEESLEELTLKVDNELKRFQVTLNRSEKRSNSHVMEAIIRILSKLAKLAQIPSQGDAARRILAEVLSSRCALFHCQLKSHVIHLQGRQTPGLAVLKAQALCELFKALLHTLPTAAWTCLPVDELLDVAKKLPSTIGHQSQLLSDLAQLVQQRDEMRALQCQHHRQNPEAEDELEWDNSEYRQVSILPTWEEILKDKPPPRLRSNIVEGPYIDWLHYYDIHFRLLREDFVASLRRGISRYVQGHRGRDLRDIKAVYNTVKISEPVCTNNGVCFEIKFDVTRMRHCRWEHSKRLLFGSLLCLSPDNFSDAVLFATVADRKPEKLAQGCLQVQFQDCLQALLQQREKKTFVMVESPAYFEASCHILKSLQTAEIDTMPFTECLIKCSCDTVEAPAYLQQRAKCSPKHPASVFDLSCFYGEAKPSMPKLEFNILDPQNWPGLDTPGIELDASQLAAIRMGLTQKVAVIQGPPGTGKTYIGLKIVEALFSNRLKWNPRGGSPIVVMCYTNHALDQFLEGVLQQKLVTKTGVAQKPKLIRIGGRSRSEAINECRLAEVAMNTHIEHNLYRRIRALKDQLKDPIQSPLKGYRRAKYYFDKSNARLLSTSQLKYLANPDHLYQLIMRLHAHRNIHRGRGTNTMQQKQQARQKQQHSEHTQEIEFWLELWDERVDYLPQQRRGRIRNPTLKRQATKKGKASPMPAPLSQNKEKALQCSVPFPTKEPKLKKREAYSGSGKGQDASKNSQTTAYLQSDEQLQHEADCQVKPTMPHSEAESEEQQGTEEQLVSIVGVAEAEEMARKLDEDEEGFKPLFEDGTEEPFSQEQQGESKEQTEIQTESSSESESSSDSDTEGEVEVPHRRVVHWVRKKKADEIIQSQVFKFTNPMSAEEADEIADIFALSLKDRWRLYHHWVKLHFQYVVENSNENFQEYNRKCEELKKLRQQENEAVLQTADIIGMTTTGASKYQHILHLIKPKIVIVEEAAEVLEAHIVSALNAGTQHLILIGDHKQLRPKPNEYNLEIEYKLNVSLFERLVRNGLPHATLEIQHRMRPEIARLVHPHIYSTLRNHDSVCKYGNVKGVSCNLFFIHHNFPERTDDHLISYSNHHEAEYIVALFKYLLLQGYEPTQITILTPYVGQVLYIRSMMPKRDCEGVRISAVDNYQGEENDIILMSLVRSNDSGTIGFLREDNRVCVALSRAKMGFYCIGNLRMIKERSKLWTNIMNDMEEKGLFGDSLELYCQQHPDVRFQSKQAKDFTTNAPNGGCQSLCTYRHNCGHACVGHCHPIHTNIKCRKTCEMKCSDGHECPQHPCYQKCLPCMEVVEKTIPSCLHVVRMHCSTDPSEIECMEPCKESCDQGHPCRKPCSELCGSCTVLIEKIIPKCHHKQMVPCHVEPENFCCRHPCEKTCPSGHACRKLCHLPCPPCNIPVAKTIPGCGHEQTVPCHINPDTYNCKHQCERTCSNDLHACKKLCYQTCSPCEVEVEKTMAICEHKQMVPCHIDPAMFQCTHQCEKLCPSGHTCEKQCHATLPCGPCKVPVPTALPCGHMISIICCKLEDPLHNHMNCNEEIVITLSCDHTKHVLCCERNQAHECTEPCPKKLKCGHQCQNLCKDICTLHCKDKVVTQGKCGHDIEMACFKAQNKQVYLPKCKEKCPKLLQCGHKCMELCGRQCTSKCNVKMPKRKWPCGHDVATVCYKARKPHQYPYECTERCQRSLKCGHKCSKKCGERCSLKCIVIVSKTLPCHHNVELECYKAQDPKKCARECTGKCRKRLKCGHKCQNKCGETCTAQCGRRVYRECPSGHVVKRVPCSSNQEAVLCTAQCTKVLSCGHQCFGRCGECNDTRLHPPCQFDVKVNHFCGKSVIVPCRGMHLSCFTKLAISCSHTVAKGPQLFECRSQWAYEPCEEPCTWSCSHYRCSQACHESCDRPPCNEPCPKQLKCRHPCLSMCGEPCLKTCPQCHPEKFKEKLYHGPSTSLRSSRYVQLDCDHIFTVEFLDRHMDPKATGPVKITPKYCPCCHQSITTSYRYGHLAKQSLKDVVAVEKIAFQHSQVQLCEALKLSPVLRIRSLFMVSTSRSLTSVLDRMTEKFQRDNFISPEENCFAMCLFNSITIINSILSQKQPSSANDKSPVLVKFKQFVDLFVRYVTEVGGAEEAYQRRQGLQHVKPECHLTEQLLADFISEQHRVVLTIYCQAIRKEPTLYCNTTAKKETLSLVENELERIDSHHSQQLSTESYTALSTKLQTICLPPCPTLLEITPPPVTKGNWWKCVNGHYFCTPPRSRDTSCPDCVATVDTH